MANKKTGDIEIGGRLFNTATGNIVAGADAIKDEAQGKTQAEINVETYEHVADIDAALQELSPDQTEALALATDVVNLKEDVNQGAVFDVSAKYPTSGVEGGNTYTLAGALAVLNANLSADKKNGGMQIRFIDSSDNKYVQYRLMSDIWSINTDNWSFCGDDVLVENPEFINVKTDKEGRILWAIKIDGSIYWGAGVPQQVIDYVNEKIAELSLDEYEDIVAFLNDLEKGDKTLQDLLNEKVDKEEGKSLIDSEYASSQSAIESPEFLDVTLDVEDKIIEGIQTDGTKVIGGDLKVLGNMEVSGVSYTVIENPEYLAAWVDVEDKVIFGIKTDGKTYIGDADFLNDIEDIKAFIQNNTDKNIDWDALSSITTVENPEFIEAITDSEGKLLAGRTPDGAAFENVSFATPKISIDGHTIENIEDPEGRSEITTDSEGKIISYRKDNGTLVENVGIETTNTTTSSLSAKEVSIEGGEATLEKATLNSLELTEQGMTDFQQALKNSGFRPGGGGDYSDTITEKGKKPVFIPTPRLARINIIWDGNLSNLSKSDRPDGVQKVNYDVKVPVEFFDGQGVYFKKYALMSAQGNSSMNFIKKNISLKFFDTEDVEGKKKKWGKGDTFGTVFGDWVMQKTYHLKAFHTDFIRGSSEVAYQLADEVYKTRGIYEDRPWKKALINFNNITSVTPKNLSEDGIDDMNLQIDNGARCMPDGFPVIVYQNGDFYGIYVWMLKKDADNFNMDTANPLHIHIDGDLNASNLWGGTINWTAFEVRNPEDLVCMDGSDYDGDHPEELIDSTATGVWDPTDENHIRSAQVKQYIIDLSHRVGEINNLNVTDSAAAKELFDTYFDADNLIDYQLINMACGDTDGFGKNWQWTTWDGVKWYVNQYDKDMAFGNYFTGMFTTAPRTGWLGTNTNLPSGLAIRYYQAEHKARWQELVNAGIFNAEHIKSMITAWISRIGKDNFVQEWKKWPEAPCNRDSKIDFEYWKFTGNNTNDTPTSGTVWDDTTSYSVGDVVWFKAFDGNRHLQFEAVKAGSNHPCLTSSYSVYPMSMGYRDSAWRYYKYIEETISNQNSFISSL